MSAVRTKSKKSETSSGKKAVKSAAKKGAPNAEILKQAKLGAMGPAWMSKSYWTDEEKPSLMTVILSRRVDGGILPIFMLVDRTCLGVKSAFAADVIRGNADWVSEVPSEKALVPCELLEAQSVIYHAIDYAKSLGFEPTTELDLQLLGERPAELLETKWAHPSRANYVSGPTDNVPKVLSQLNSVIGVGNYDFVVGAPFQAMKRAEAAESESVDDLF